MTPTSRFSSSESNSLMVLLVAKLLVKPINDSDSLLQNEDHAVISVFTAHSLLMSVYNTNCEVYF